MNLTDKVRQILGSGVKVPPVARNAAQFNGLGLIDAAEMLAAADAWLAEQEAAEDGDPSPEQIERAEAVYADLLNRRRELSKAGQNSGAEVERIVAAMQKLGDWSRATGLAFEHRPSMKSEVSRFRDLAQSIATVDRQEKNAQASLKAAQAAKGDAQQRIEKLECARDERRRNLAALSAESKVVADEVGELLADEATGAAVDEAKIRAAQKRHEELVAKMSEARSVVQALERRIEPIRGELNAADGQIQEVTHRLDELRQVRDDRDVRRAAAQLAKVLGAMSGERYSQHDAGDLRNRALELAKQGVQRATAN